MLMVSQLYNIGNHYYYSYINQEISVLVEFDKKKGCLCLGEEEFDLIEFVLDLDLMNISIVGWFG